MIYFLKLVIVHSHVTNYQRLISRNSRMYSSRPTISVPLFKAVVSVDRSMANLSNVGKTMP